MKFIKNVLSYLRSKIMTIKYVDSGSGRIKLSDAFVNVKIKKEKGSQIILNGKLILQPHFGGNSTTSITMGENSQLVINGNFVLGDGIKIFINSNAKLILGGCKNEPTSGITSNSVIMVYKKITIGKDFLCSWNTFITDCDWHSMEGIKPYSEVSIGDHVWVGNNCSILKGTTLNDNVVVTSYSKLININMPKSVMIAGVPAKIIKENVRWSYFV
jgi:acetyltransferase-like isoleucine patch superfamily enzyme